MDIKLLQSILEEGESERIEFKQDTSSEKFPEQLCKTVCAFSNRIGEAKAAYLLVGVDDAGNLSGFEDSNRQSERITQMINNGKITPIPDTSVDSITHEGNEILVVKVMPSTLIHYYSKNAWVRQEKTTVEAKVDDLRRLEWKAPHRSFETGLCRKARMEDLSEELFAVYRKRWLNKPLIAENNRTFCEQLAALNFADSEEQYPTHAGVLILGEDPQRFLPMAYVNAVYIDDSQLNNRDRIKDQQEIGGTLVEQARTLRSLAKVWNPLSQREMGDMSVEYKYEYALEALEELLFNALIHRDYSLSTPIRFHWFADRVEILSPGGLESPARFAETSNISGTAYRNPVLAGAFKTLDLIEKFGNGIQRAIEAVRLNQQPAPEFDITEDYVKVTLYPRKPQ